MKLDTLARRKRFAPPQPDGHNIVLSERDYLIFEIINRHGPLPSTYLYELTRHLPKSKDFTRFLKRLTKLYDGFCTNWHTHSYEIIDGEHMLNPKHTCNLISYLSRPDWQGQDKSRPLIYDLNPISRGVLEERGVRVINRTDYHLHRFMGACVGSSLKLYLESQRFGYSDLDEVLAHPKCPPATRELDNPLTIPLGSVALIPDDFLAIESDKPFFYAVEIDRKTESIDTKIATSSIARKFEHYIQAFASRAFYHHLGIPEGRVSVLIITTNRIHKSNMQTHLRKAHPEFAHRFLFTSVSGFGKNWQVPKELLYLKWEDGNGNEMQMGSIK
jgi:hypothetical protein